MEVKPSAVVYGSQRQKFGGSFVLLALYIVVEYARPSFIAAIRPALILQVMIFFLLLSKSPVLTEIFKEKYFKNYLFLLMLMVLHVFIATNNYWAFKYFQAMLTYLLVSLAFCVFLDSFDKLTRFVSFFVLVMALCAVSRLAGSGLIGGAGFMGDENDFALAMNVALPLSFFLGKGAKGWRKGFFLSASVLFVLGNIISTSRGGFLGLVAVGAACWAYSRHKFRDLVFIALLATLAWSFAPAEFKQEVSQIGVASAEQGTGQDRVELWKVGWRAYLDNPILGVGQGNMPLVMEKYQYDSAGESFWQRGVWGKAIHSVYFTLLPELGLVGLILLGGMLKVLVQKYRKTNQLLCAQTSSELKDKMASLNVALVTSVFGYMVTGIFLSAFYYPQFWNLAALIVALNFVASRAKTSETHPLQKKGRFCPPESVA